MIYLISLKSFSNIIIIFILFYLLNFCYNEDCITHSFPDLKYAKVLTLENGHQLMVTTTGMISFYPGLGTYSNTCTFTEDQKIQEGVDSMGNTINQVEIAQFSDEEGGKRYTIAIAKNYLYFMNEKGVLFFSQKLENFDTNSNISLKPYKYVNDKYTFIIAYNKYNNINNKNNLFLHFFTIVKNHDYYNLTRDYYLEYFPEINGVIYSMNPTGLSCQVMISSSRGKVLVCFESLMNLYKLSAFIFDPESNNKFELLEKNEGVSLNINVETSYIKSVLNGDKSIALVCYSIKTNSVNQLKCYNYNINSNSFSRINEATFCNTQYFGFEIYFFEKPNEFSITCINTNKNSFTFFRLDSSSNINYDAETAYDQVSFAGCSSYDIYSIIYISKVKKYSVVINSNCNNQNNIRIFMLNKNTCIMPTPETTIITTLPIITTIITTLPITTIITTILQTTIITTIPESSIITTLPESTIISTIPLIETTIVTTIPVTESTIITTIPIKKTIIISTFPTIETTILIQKTSSPKILTTLFSVETTIIETIPNIITTFIEKFPSFSSIPIKKEMTDYITEQPCEDKNKIYYEGKCICDNNNGYYSFNYDNQCYKLEEFKELIKTEKLPKNIYFNNITNSYEFCYKTCGTCIKGGDLSENNCQSCAPNYIKEPENNSSNCVENCDYFYYYNTLNQYSCSNDEQCPEDASLIVRNINKCTSKCIYENINKYQYNGECILSCPNNTEPNNHNICQIKNKAICSSGEYKLNLNESIAQENVQLVAKNYANEFYYTVNHISTFTSDNFTMALYKNSSCIDELKLNITKIEYDSCIKQLKIDNNIDENKDLIIAVVDIINNGKIPVTSFGFFNPDTGEKLNASKSCSDKSVMMYENILSLLDDPLSLQLLEKQKINIFDENDAFYKDICFHFDSPNGKDATLQDRMKSFYPNVTLCDVGCKNKGINITTMKAECECIFQDLLSKNIIENDLLGDNILIKESIQEVVDIINNLNIEVLMCFKDVFTYKYFIKNKSGFIIMSLFILFTICVIFYYLKSKNKTIRYIYALSENYILLLSTKIQSKKNMKLLTNCPVKKNNNKLREEILDKDKEMSNNKINEKDINDINSKVKIKKIHININKDKITIKDKNNIKNKTNYNKNNMKVKYKPLKDGIRIRCNTNNKDRKKFKDKSMKDKIKIKSNTNNRDSIKKKDKDKRKNKSRDNIQENKIFKNISKDSNYNKNKLNFKQINIMNFNFKSLNGNKKSAGRILRKDRSSSRLKIRGKTKIVNNLQKTDRKRYNNKSSSFELLKQDISYIKKTDNIIDINEFLEASHDEMDYDDVIDNDKRTFWQYFCEKIKDNQIIINSFFIQEIIKRKSIKIAEFIVIIDIYLLTNGLFYSDSYISEIFNSNEKETLISFIPRSIDRFIYTTILINIIAYIINFFFIDEIKIKKILLRNKNNALNLRFEISEILKSIFKNIRILIIINYILIIFSWYYLSCFNNVYPNINNEWILSSIFLIVIFQILPFILTLIETTIRFASIRYESEKLFKLSQLLS